MLRQYSSMAKQDLPSHSLAAAVLIRQLKSSSGQILFVCKTRNISKYATCKNTVESYLQRRTDRQTDIQAKRRTYRRPACGSQIYNLLLSDSYIKSRLIIVYKTKTLR